ncbi:MAG: YlxR family protein [Clostridia bacterium]|nr:YlxR family protein [Clostridia bacterium]
MPKERKTPLRTCVACRETQDKKTLVRIVKTKEGEIFPDFSGKAAGRGAYVCTSADCFARLKKNRLLNRAFSADVPEEVYTRLEEAILAKK